MSARRKTADAAEPEDIGARILHHLAGHDSKKPARADDVATRVGGERAAFWAALQELTAARQVASAQIQKQGDPTPWLAIWPTGIRPRQERWDSNSHTSLFGKSPIPLRLPAAPDPNRDPRPDLGYATRPRRAEVSTTQETTMPKTRTTTNRDKVATMIAGRGKAEAVELNAIAAEIGLTVQGATYLVKALEKAGDAAYIVTGTGKHCRSAAFDPRAQAASAQDERAAMAKSVGQDLARALDAGGKVEQAVAAPAAAASEDPAESPERRRNGELRARISASLEGVAARRALSLAEIGAVLADDGGSQTSPAAIALALKSIEAAGEIRSTSRPRPDGQRGPRVVTAWFDASADGDDADAPADVCRAVTPLSAREMLTGTPPSNHPDEPVRFAMFDNGELAVLADGLLVVVPPADARRLAALLGVNGGAA